MTLDEFTEALRRIVADAENSGLALEAELEEQAAAIRECEAEPAGAAQPRN